MPDTASPTLPTPAPLPTPAERRGQATFQAVLWSLSYPGRVQTLEGDPFADIGEALLDLEVSFYTPDADLSAHLLRTGARPASPAEAEYLLFPHWNAEATGDLRQAKLGTPVAPDESATLLLTATLNGAGPTFTLIGPGIDGSLNVQIGDVPPAFWALRAAACRFPLGWDTLLIDPASGLLLGLPRTTRITSRNDLTGVV